MLGLIKGLFSSGIVGSVERIASEFIETDMESAEAKALMVKTLDPNGMMRRQLSNFACMAYGFFLCLMSVLALMCAFGLGDAEGAKSAMAVMAELFLPITASWATIVGASFGVNGLNANKGR